MAFFMNFKAALLSLFLEAFYHLTFMIDCAPQVMSFTIYLHKDFIQVPFPITGLHAPCPLLFDLACELRTKSMPPVPNGFIGHIDTAFMQKVFYISQ